MTTEVIVAIISGIAGITGAVIAWFQSVRTARLKAETELALEKMKAEHERFKANTQLAVKKLKLEGDRRKKAFEMACQESVPGEEAVSQAWKDIQIIKEEIARILSDPDYHADLALESMRPAVQRLYDGYETWGSVLAKDAEDAGAAWYRAKGVANTAQRLVTKYSPVKRANPQLPPHAVEQLRNIRVCLTDDQTTLADTRQRLRDVHIQRILEVL